MDCEICFEPFDLTGKRPKSLPCAHNTFCLACINRLPDQKCPLCRTDFSRATSLPDNFSLMRVLEQLTDRPATVPSFAPSAPPLESTPDLKVQQEDDWWCVDCEAVPQVLCRERHDVLRLQPVDPVRAPVPEPEPSSDRPKVPKLESDWSQGWWCVECEASAKDVCKDEHLVLRHKAAQQRRDEENQALRTPARKSASCDSHRQSSVSRESSRLSMNMDRLTLTALRDICETCKEPIHGAITHAKDKHFHPDHFVCAYCYKKLGSYFFKDSKFYCEDDYHNLFSPRCASCRVPIRDKVTTALQKTWHPEHFCCFHCQQPFDGASFYTENNKPYCRKDFSNLFAPKCHGCKRPIMERYTTCQGKNWHNECFKERT